MVYQTVESLVKARDDMQRQLADANPNRVRRRKQTYLFQNGRGYH